MAKKKTSPYLAMTHEEIYQDYLNNLDKIKTIKKELISLLKKERGASFDIYLNHDDNDWDVHLIKKNSISIPSGSASTKAFYSFEDVFVFNPEWKEYFLHNIFPTQDKILIHPKINLVQFYYKNHPCKEIIDSEILKKTVNNKRVLSKLKL